ncbi:radical SAM protein [Aerosakkonema funiforme]|uniref:Radical SAM protein n=2 Tax=Oscillatoriophycideae TaxID=1301283 RepID=A0A926ZKA6_9CYAN|nr:radical SAM protein [Aerosakkonema funiforme]MBD2185574.1 radical SAM protein [Aerosakkonema funiforme FACHB-1375]
MVTLEGKKAPSIGLVELPGRKLIDPEGKNWTDNFKYTPLPSKQILLAHLQALGFDAQLVDLRDGDCEEEYGEVIWRGMRLSKRYDGKRITSLDPHSFDAWGVTNNFVGNRQLALMTIQHLSRGGRPVVVGGSDAIAEPHIYLQAGATAIVLDKTGGANKAIYDYVLGRPMEEKLSGVLLADGSQYPSRLPPMSPEDWPLPSVEVAKQCLSRMYYKPGVLGFPPSGSVMPDLGCDRKCDFCQTPTYQIGYRRMTPQRALQWFSRQKEAGANSVICLSDQFLGRVLFKEGKQEVLEIMQGVRDLGLALNWCNGLEIKKATKGRGYERSPEDLIPDDELIQALWGWDGKIGCYEAFIPAERPVVGRESYAKLLPWKQHCDMLRAIVNAGVARLQYGVVIGLPEDSHETMLRLEEAISELYQDLKSINPALQFWVGTYAISPIPGTPQGHSIRGSGLVRFTDPEILGGFMTACADTHHMSYEEVSDWELRLVSTGDGGLDWFFGNSNKPANQKENGSATSTQNALNTNLNLPVAVS